MKFNKYHALGNVYLVFGAEYSDEFSNEKVIRKLCNRHFGIGSDGILLGPLPSSVADFGLRIFNPDASEAEKSGNGLRIFCRYLWDVGLIKEEPFSIETKGGVVRAQVLRNGNSIKVDMGTVSFSSTDIPVVGASREVLLETIEINNRQFEFCAATIGNPHCVVRVDSPSEALAREFGPLLETHAFFPNRTNVQFMRVIDRNAIFIEIWERGAGYTYSSGSSSCASAAVAHRLGLCDSNIAVFMPGGRLDIEVNETFGVTMTGPVVNICEGSVSIECLLQNI